MPGLKEVPVRNGKRERAIATSLMVKTAAIVETPSAGIADPNIEPLRFTLLQRSAQGCVMQIKVGFLHGMRF